MLPELGKHAVPVLSAYGISLALIAGLVLVSLRKSARVRAELAQFEGKVRGATQEDV